MSNVFFYDEIFSNFNWKNMIFIYENDFSWKKLPKFPNIENKPCQCPFWENTLQNLY
jgi:hypothetical protein